MSEGPGPVPEPSAPDNWNRPAQARAAAAETFVDPEPEGPPVAIVGLMLGHFCLALVAGLLIWVTWRLGDFICLQLPFLGLGLGSLWALFRLPSRTAGVAWLSIWINLATALLFLLTAVAGLAHGGDYRWGGVLLSTVLFLVFLNLYRQADQLLKQIRRWEKIEQTAADRLDAASRAEAEMPVTPGWDEKDRG